MALKRLEDPSQDVNVVEKTKVLFGRSTPEKEKKILTTFSIEPSFKKELEELFEERGLCWAAGIRFALKEFVKKYSN